MATTAPPPRPRPSSSTASSPTSTPTACASSSRDRPRRDRWPHCRARRQALDRIVVRWNRAAVPSDHVNPIYFKRVEQIHRVDRSLKAIPSDPDLLSVSAISTLSRILLIVVLGLMRSEERRVGKRGVRTGRYQWVP